MSNPIKYLSQYSDPCPNDYTHTAITPVKGSYYIEDRHLDGFFDCYCDAFRNVPPELGITEKISCVSPLIVDIDLKVRADEEKGGDGDLRLLYSISKVIEIIKVYHGLLTKYFPNIPKHYYQCILLEKPAYRSERYIKNGFHLHFPWIFMTISDIKIYIEPEVEIQVNHIFNTKCFDTNSTHVPWLMYGSVKGEGMKPYMATAVIDLDLETVGLEVMAGYKVYTRGGGFIEIDADNVVYNLPRILSVFLRNREVQTVCSQLLFNSPYLKHHLSSMLIQNSSSRAENMGENNASSTSPTETMQLLNMISAKRSENENDWMRIGWALFNIFSGSVDGLKLWMDFSSKCGEKYSEHICLYKWSKMKESSISAGTLKYFASQDSPAEYGIFKSNQSKNGLLSAASGFHTQIASIMYEDFKDEFVCLSTKSKRWMFFRDHIWNVSEDGSELRSKISSNVLHQYENILSNLKKKIDDEQNSDFQKDLYTKREKQVQNLIGKLQTSPFKDSVMKECAELFYNKHFENTLDRNPNIIGFSNGIFDLKTFQLRPGTPEDLITKKMEICYREFSPHDPNIADVLTFFKQIFPDEEIREYFLDTISTLFKGGNYEKKIYVWSGVGDNGKSVTMKLIEKMLGPLCVHLPTSIITGKRTQSSSACPELTRCGGGVRITVVQEPEKRDKMNIGIAKELSGNDALYARDLYQQGSQIKEIIPMFKFILVCNQPPSATEGDKAFFNRLRIIPFESIFEKSREKVPDTEEERMSKKIFLMDTNIERKFDKMAEPLAYFLLQRFQSLLNGKVRNEPSKVIMATDNFKNKNDLIRQFISESVTIGETNSVSLYELYGCYKMWCRESCSRSVIIDKLEFREEITKHWGEMSGLGLWTGYGIKINVEKSGTGTEF
jgi:P4 family phage/plasmid primase-like protien